MSEPEAKPKTSVWTRPIRLRPGGTLEAVGSLTCFVGFWLAACISSTSSDGTDSSDSTSTENGDPDCTPEDSAMEVVFYPEDANPEGCVVSTVKQDPTDEHHWMIAFDCDAGTLNTELSLDPPLQSAPLLVGEQVSGTMALGPEGHYVEFLVEGQLRLIAADLRLPGAGTPVDEPLFPVGLVRLDWSDAPGCMTVDPLCGVVDLRGAEAYLDTTLDPQIATLGPEQPYGEIMDSAQRFGVWLGVNWISECGGETTSQVSYVIAALP